MSWPLRQSTQSKYICVPTVRHVPLAERATKMLEMCKSEKKKTQGTAKKQQATPKRPPMAIDGVYSCKLFSRAKYRRQKENLGGPACQQGKQTVMQQSPLPAGPADGAKRARLSDEGLQQQQAAATPAPPTLPRKGPLPLAPLPGLLGEQSLD